MQMPSNIHVTHAYLIRLSAFQWVASLFLPAGCCFLFWLVAIFYSMSRMLTANTCHLMLEQKMAKFPRHTNYIQTQRTPTHSFEFIPTPFINAF